MLLGLAGLTATPGLAGQGSPGQERQRPRVYAVTGATVMAAPGTTLEGATVVLRDGLIEAVGTDVEAPADATVIDGTGMTVWPGWIDAYTTIGLAEPEPPANQGGGRGFGRGGGRGDDEPDRGTGHPIERVHPEYDVTDDLVAADDDMARHRAAGFTTALVVPRDGVYRGQAAVIALGRGPAAQLVVAEDVAQVVGFSSGGFGGGYPGSLMGVIATIRQVLLDTQRYSAWVESWERDPVGIQRPERIDSFPALQPVLAGEQPVIFETPNARTVERVIKIHEEFGLRPVVVGSGEDYKSVGLLRDAGLSVIVPVDYPDRPEVGEDTPDFDVSLEDLQEWERAPGNAAALATAGIPFAFTTQDLGNVADFRANVRKAIEAGLPEEEALRGLTLGAAEILGIDSVLGSIEAGKIASVVVGTGDPFAEDTRIRHVFVDGTHYEIEAGGPGGGMQADGPVDPRGTWRVSMGMGGQAQEMTWTIDGREDSWFGSVNGPQGSVEFQRIDLEGNALTVAMTTPQGAFDVTVYIRGDRFTGTLAIQDFSIDVSGRRTSGPGVVVSDGGSR